MTGFRFVYKAQNSLVGQMREVGHVGTAGKL